MQICQTTNLFPPHVYIYNYSTTEALLELVLIQQQTDVSNIFRPYIIEIKNRVLELIIQEKTQLFGHLQQWFSFYIPTVSSDFYELKHKY